MIQRILDYLKGKPAAKRSNHWPAVRLLHLKQFPCCAVCGSKAKVEVHHIRPFHLFPELELEPTNFLTLCEGSGNHHFWVGHLGDWQAWNPYAVEDAAIWREKIKRRRTSVAA